MIRTRRNGAMYSKLLTYFRNEALMSNFLLKALFVLTLAQQIYWPQKHEYFHLALLFMFMIFIDIYDEDHRPIPAEMSFMLSIFGATTVSLVERWTNLNLELLYFGFLIGGALVTMTVLWQLVKTFKSPSEHHKVAKRNHNLFKKKLHFVIGILYSLEAVLALTIGYVVYLAVLSLL